MLFYGDRCRERDPRQLWDELDARLAMALAMPSGLSRHAALTTSLIEWGALLQGVADAAAAARDFDREGPAETALAGRLRAIADALRCPLDRLGWKGGDNFPAAPRPLLPERVVLRAPEGYLHYAVYPESYRAAAQSLAIPVAGVIGIRSIGTGLAAMVAAASGSAAAMTLRPRGEPFRRRIVADPAMAERLRQADGAIAVVDEGPGLSGSSFIAVIDWLEQAGVAPRRIHLFPSHDRPPGPQASDDTARRWPRYARHVVPFDRLFLSTGNAAHRLAVWLERALGPLDGPLEDLSAGAWRGIVHGPPTHWPPAIPTMERRKYRALAGGRRVLVKFAGLGPLGERKLALARALAAAGFTAEPLALLHGFLVEDWLPAAPHRRLDQLPRPALVARLADYLGFRARAFPAAADEGAGLPELVAMAVRNTAARLGAAAGDRLAAALASLPRHGPALRRCATDNRLQPFEWQVGPDGRLMKMDALDHAFGHDLVGCQDIAWDVAGAVVEFDLAPAERETLAHGVERRAGRDLGRDLIRLLEPCYLACELARLYYGMATTPGPADRRQLCIARQRYTRKLRNWLG
jgi:hypothetical protein